MLDFAQLLNEIEAMAEARKARQPEAQRSLTEAREQIESLSGGWQELADQLTGRQWPWVMAIPREPLNFRRAAPDIPPCYAVAASDGSQIAPDRHEVSSCYLLNISSIRLSYGDGERPLLTCRPRLYYEEKDLSIQEGGVKLPIEGKYLAIRRMLEETLQLVALLRETARDGRPCLGLADGTLIQWPISREAQGYSGQALETFLSALDDARDAGSPVVGYISDPGGSSVIATLRAALCPSGFLEGKRCPCTLPAPDSPAPAAPVRTCELLARTSDSTLFGAVLNVGERGALFESTSQVLTRYGDHSICFFYLNVGREIARVELPLWAARDEAMTDQIHAIILDQALKGKGYPVALSEAHERAVVQAGDRALFYQMVEKAFLKRGLPAELSLKSISKRQPLV